MGVPWVPSCLSLADAGSRLRATRPASGFDSAGKLLSDPGLAWPRPTRRSRRKQPYSGAIITSGETGR